MSKQDSLVRSTLLLTLVGIISQAMSFFYRVMLSRLIGAETMGLYQLIMPVYSVIMSITISGLTVALSSLSAGYYASGNQRATTQLLRSALRGLVMLWLPIAVVVCLFSKPLSQQVLGDGRTRLGLMLLLPVLLLTGVENLNKHHFYGIGETRLPAAVEIAEQFIRTAAILSLLIFLLPLSQEYTVAVIVLGMIVSEIFSSSTLTILRRKREGPYRRQPGTPDAPKTIRRKLSNVAVPVSGAALLNNLISSADSVLVPQKLMLFGFSSSEAMEVFGVVFGMTLPMLMIPFAFVNALCLALLPRLTRCAALRQTSELNQKTTCALQSTSLIVLPLLALLVTMGGDIGKVLFQEERVGAYILPLAITVIFSSYENVLCAVLNGVGKQSASAGISLICGLLQLAFTWFGVERFGLTACIVGMILGSILGFFLRLRLAIHSTGLSVDVYSSFIGPGLAATLSGSCVNLLYQVLLRSGLSDLTVLLSCVVFGLFLYVITLDVQGFPLLGFFHISANSSQSSMHRKRSS